MPRRTVVSDPVFGSTLKELREHHGISLRRLGQMVHCSHGYLWDLENSTKRPSQSVADLLDRALRADGRLASLVRESSADGARRSDHIARADVGLDFPTHWRHGAKAAVELWRGDMQRRELLHGAGFSAVAFLPATMRWLVSSFDEKPTGDGEHLIGRPDIEIVRRVTATYRALDNQLGGGHIRGSLVRFLNTEATDLINGRYDAATGRALLSAVAEATQLAGWASYDAGMHGLAQRYLVQALRFAAVAGDRALGAEILAAMSHQAAYLNASLSGSAISPRPIWLPSSVTASLPLAEVT